MREMRLKYLITLGSNIDAKVARDAQAMEDANKKMQGALKGTDTALDKLNKTQDGTGRGADTATGKTKTLGRELERLGESADVTTAKTGALERVIRRVGTNTSTERQIGYIHRLGTAMDIAREKAAKMQKVIAGGIANGIDKAPEIAAGMGGAYYGGSRVFVPFIGAYANLESATEDLRVAMLDSSGMVSKDFEKIAAEAKALGEKLPGGTKDFMLGARALIEQGTPTSVIAGGGLRASSYFGALMGMDQYQSATTVAKVREAHGLADNELVPAADLMQRARYAFGIAPTDYLEVAKYAAPTYNTMKLTGLEKMKELLAVQGMAAQVGLEASSFGTNFSMMLTNAAKFDSRLGKGSKEAKEVRDLLGEHKIKMDFFTPKGEWAGTENMLAQLSKIRPLSTQDQIKVMNRLFGVEAGRPAMILAQKGLESYRSALGRIDDQASLDQRIEMKMQTFSAKKEAMAGAAENTQAQIAKQTGEKLKPVMDWTGSTLSGPVQDFFEKHPGAGSAGLLSGTALGAWLAAKGFSKVFGGSPVPPAPTSGAPVAPVPRSTPTVLSGAAKFSMLARGLVSALNPLMLLEVLGGPSEDDIAKLREMDRQKFGYRGQHFNDPRRLDYLPLTSPNQGAHVDTQAAAGANELKIGEGKLTVDVRVTDERVTAVPSVVQQPSMIRISPGLTNPGSLKP